MSPEEALRQLEERCHTGDSERDHCEADEILVALLRSLGHEGVADAFEAVGGWYA